MPFQPGQSGNPAGRPRGSRNKATIIAEQLFDDSAGELTRAAIARALDGDPAMLRACLDRVVPPLRHRPLDFDLPQLITLADAPVAINAIAQGLAHGELNREEAVVLLRLVREFTRALAAVERATRAAAPAAQAVDASRPDTRAGLDAADGRTADTDDARPRQQEPRGEQQRESIAAPGFPARNTGATAICEINSNFSRHERGSRVTPPRQVADRRMSRRCLSGRSTWKSVSLPNSECV